MTWNPDKVRLAIAKDLRAIELLYQGIWAEILANAGNPDMPGGDAMVMVGPSANPEAWSYRELSAAMGRTTSHGDYEDTHDPQPPLLVLATWSDAIRKERGQDTALAASISRECAYIGRSVDWMLSADENGDINFIAVDDLADDLHKMRRRMEDLLHIGERPERTRVTCIKPDCTGARLIKVYGSRAAWDFHKCPECGARYEYPAFLQAKAENLRADGTERFVLVQQATDAIEGLPDQTMRSWMRRMVVRSACNIQTRRLEVWWPDVRDAAEARRRRLLAKSTGICA